MKRVLSLAVTMATAIAAPAVAADCDIETRPQIEAALNKTPLETGLADGVRSLLAKPRYFEDPKLGAVCSQPTLNHPLYPGIPVKECAYQRLGLTGWVMVANPGADVVSKWISNACAETSDAKTCAVRLTTHAWCASQFSFPVVGDLIEPASTAPGKAAGVNTAFLHGVVIERPKWLPEKTPVTAEVQKQRLSPLAASEKAYAGLAGRVSWPADVSPDVYAKYAKSAGEPNVGASCPVLARRTEWLAAARTSYNLAWRTGRNRMFDTAAKALMAGEQPDGPDCK